MAGLEPRSPEEPTHQPHMQPQWPPPPLKLLNGISHNFHVSDFLSFKSAAAGVHVHVPCPVLAQALEIWPPLEFECVLITTSYALRLLLIRRTSRLFLESYSAELLLYFAGISLRQLHPLRRSRYVAPASSSL